MFSRSSGILLHISSLPGKYGIGSLGKEAYRFVDFLSNARQKLWQVLPLCPMSSENCPYIGLSAFAGNHTFIDMDILIEEGLLKKSDTEDISFHADSVNYSLVNTVKLQLLKKSYANFISNKNLTGTEYKSFCSRNVFWLDDYSLFMALRAHNNGPWHKWEKELKLRNKIAVKKAAKDLEYEIGFHKYLQFVFFKQWTTLKKYANKKGIKIIGDNPIYVSYESCDVWTNPELFLLNKELKPIKVSGVPPDYFSKTGQLWGHPLYNWKKHKSTGFEWWVKNMRFTYKTIDILRIDHFIGFVNYWAVPFGNKTALNGKWEKAPGSDLFKRLKEELGNIPVIAEDLGNKTSGVEKLMKKMNFPGMKLLQEGIKGGKNHPFAPQNFDTTNYVVYTSTHDSDTVKGWFNLLNPSYKKIVLQYLRCDENGVVKEMIRQAWDSVAVFAIAQMQDILESGSEARMNIPGKKSGNWQWRMKEDYSDKVDVSWLSEITKLYDR